MTRKKNRIESEFEWLLDSKDDDLFMNRLYSLGCSHYRGSICDIPDFECLYKNYVLAQAFFNASMYMDKNYHIGLKYDAKKHLTHYEIAESEILAADIIKIWKEQKSDNINC